MNKSLNPVKQGIFNQMDIVSKLLKLSACVPILIIAACSSDGNGGNKPVISNSENTNKQIGLLLPLSGRNGPLGTNMMQAAKLALSDPTAPKLDVFDTEQAGGAAEAARKAIAAGDGIILGPLTATNTTEVASVTASQNVPVIAYTSDVSVAGPNVWAFGVTPEQQVLTMVRAAKNEGRTKFAALLPENPMGKAMGAALTKACADLGLMVPTITYHTASKDDITQQLKNLSNYDARVQAAKSNPASQNISKTPTDTASNDSNLLDELAPSEAKPTDGAKAVEKINLGAPPFDALLLSDTGLQLQSVIDALGETQVSSDKVRIMGPGLWGAFASKLGKLQGAWYASPDPQKRKFFAQQYRVKYGVTPKPLADLTYDTAALANSLSKIGGYTTKNLTRADGFDGVDGLFVLQPDGHVKRDLQIFQIQPSGGGKIISTPSVIKPAAGSTNS
ncbi:MULTISPECIES: penicillin-binding protein activator [Commensalibacter]|uniref:ABC transporter amino acid transporter substrate-binding periplasmic protein n=2 Tax=Commensalibacter TaxID=1079922 RepID=W7DUI6_9PROT|nr:MULTISPECIES: penicillin-binding protein activator [Commensalibacter]EUK17928.1 ABC transporter amino acid transporter substrate-binding periplasmic protein [Commensalibacter papalotli (ex Servin-Garciduenas et al. 2014)]CAI3941608.1 ABC-type branched-chain amino acid transport system [Commensalibacter papalotli (ex Botero et al. 2024)]CAI3949356.1 ABC-type branched-chain amino acid transport system [Commensalibacter papalotli (ex Botero et al. 2024)]